ncbi:MAG: hypothetical protein LBJ86_01490 [Spirochaetaceae bacterium]|jgi:hypothetical protein|nr:hypothetical protein [Spirochaetaceae bacterium]
MSLSRKLKISARSFLPFCLLALCGMFFLPCCKRFSVENAIALPVTRPLSRTVIGYGVATANYTRILDNHGDGGRSIGFLRKGSIVEILERRPVVTDYAAEMWVLASGSYKGWLKENELQVYQSRAQAVTASQTMPQ